MLTAEDAAIRQSEEQQDFDPYLYRAEMPLSRLYFPLGFPVRLTTNSVDVIEAAKESWGVFTQEFDIAPLHVNVGVLPGESTECPPAPFFRAQRNLIVSTADRENFCVSDLAQGFSFLWLTEAVVSHRSYLRYHFLESAPLCHIANRYTAPVHAACVVRDGRGVLLCGDSGAGKSSLAFACARAGWTYVTDDASFLSHSTVDRRVVGNCHSVRFRPSASDLFAEVAGRSNTPRATGKPSIEIPTAEFPAIATATSAHVDFVVFLRREGINQQKMRPYPQDSARSYIHKHLCGTEEYRRPQVASVERLLSAELLELHYRDLEWAVGRLNQLVTGEPG